MAFDVPGRGVAQTPARGLDLGGIDIGKNDLRPAHTAEVHVAAITAADIKQRVVGAHGEPRVQLVSFLVEPAAEFRVVKAERVRINLVGNRSDRFCRSLRRRCRREFLQKAQHEVAPGEVTAIREEPRRLTSAAPRLRIGISTTR